MKLLFLPLIATLAACAAQPPLTRAPARTERFTASSDDSEPSDSNGNEAWSSVYLSTELRDLAWHHLGKVELGYYEAPSTMKVPSAEGNVSGSFSGVAANPDFTYFEFPSSSDAESFLTRIGAAPAPYVSQLYDIQTNGDCVTVNVLDHFWQEPSHMFGLRTGQRIYGEHLKNFLVQAGSVKGVPEEKKAPLTSQKFCVGDQLQAGGRKLHITKVTAGFGLNVSSAPGATYPTYPAMILADEAGKALLTESNALRRLKLLNEAHTASARASSNHHTCGSSLHATSEDFAITSAQANERAKALLAAQCETVGRHLNESHVQFEVSKYDVCFETGWNQADSIAHGQCD
jgi:hypothetical protein